jgi:hypothetical protein
VVLKQYCVYFHDGRGRTILGKSKEDIRQKYDNVRSVFVMGRK